MKAGGHKAHPRGRSEGFIERLSFRQYIGFAFLCAFAFVGMFSMAESVLFSQGYAFDVVTCCNSMYPEIRDGCLAVFEYVEDDEIWNVTTGDVVSYIHPVYRETSVVHRVIGYCEDDTLLIKGDNNPHPDGCFDRHLVRYKVIGSWCPFWVG